MSYHVIIVDDDERQQESLQGLLEHFPEFNLVGKAASVNEAEKLILSANPHLVFLDVELPPHTSFDLLEKLGPILFKIIFTTAYDKYAIRAFRFSAIDYLLKPIVKEELADALEKFKKEEQAATQSSNIQNLLANLQLPPASQKIALPTLTGFLYVTVHDIIRCESDNTYTTFYLTDKRKIIVSKTLKEVEHMLTGFRFSRVHNSHLINCNYIMEYIKGEGGIVKMTDGSHVDVSRRRKEEFLLQLKKG